MDTNDHKNIRQMFDDYLRMYASRDDRLTDLFSEDFSGFTGGGDFPVKERQAWVAITRQDFAQVTDPLRMTLKISRSSRFPMASRSPPASSLSTCLSKTILSRETARQVHLLFYTVPRGRDVALHDVTVQRNV